MNKPVFANASASEERLAARANDALAAMPSTLALRAKLDDGSDVIIPQSATRLLRRALEELAKGAPVTLLLADAELTTQEAADYLNVSRPHIVRLLDDGAIPSRKVGTHRRVRADVIEAFRLQSAKTSEQAMNELAEQAQELDFGY